MRNDDGIDKPWLSALILLVLMTATIAGAVGVALAIARWMFPT